MTDNPCSSATLAPTNDLRGVWQHALGALLRALAAPARHRLGSFDLARSLLAQQVLQRGRDERRDEAVAPPRSRLPV